MAILNMLPEISSEPLAEIAKGYQLSQVLFTAIDYDMFDLLRDPKTAQQISEEIKTDPLLTEKFLNVLVALGLLSKTNDRYTNTKLAATFLVADSPFYQGNLIRMAARNYPNWANLRQTLKDGGIQKATQEKHDYIDRVFTLGHAEGALSGSLQRAVNAVAALPEFKKANKLLDLGGGHGLYAIAFAQLNPGLDVTIFDLPHVLDITRTYLEHYGMLEQIRLMPGDFTVDELGSGYDIVFASDVTISDILEKVYSALRHDGILIYRRWTLNDDGAGPLTSALFELMLSMMGSNHHVCSLREYTNTLKEAGFLITRIIDVSTASDPAKILIAKKREI